MTDIFNTYCLGECSPALIISLDTAINDVSKVAVYDENGKHYCNALFAYSLDGICWSSYGTQDQIYNITAELTSDFFVRIKVNGVIGKVQVCNQDVKYSVSLDTGFTFGSNCTNNSNVYSPYANMDTAIALQQQLVDNVSCIVGIPIYYFRVVPNADSKDLTFKEYCLLNVKEVKQIKLIVSDGQMPSSKPAFNEFGIDFEMDWETFISKTTFATAFGNDAKPMEHDIIYIPMMDRMWMVNSAYEEKKDAYMWNATYFTVSLVKYQEKDSIDLGDQEEFVGQLVTSKYEELFGEDEAIVSGEQTTTAPLYRADSLYSIFESDATRKQASMDTIEFYSSAVYNKAAKITETWYRFSQRPATVVYLHKYCGDECSISFLIHPDLYANEEDNIINIGHISIKIDKDKIYIENCPDIYVNIKQNKTFFVFIRWSRKLNIVNIQAAEYTYPTSIPLYKLKPFHHYFEMDNPYSKCINKFNIELVIDTPLEVFINNFNGLFSNFKLFKDYIDNDADLMQQYPNNSHLIINDTARQFVRLVGNSL